MSRRRHTLRIALASAAVAGAVLAPVSTAFAAPHTPAAAAAKSSPVRTVKLLDGSVAKVYKGAKEYRAEVLTSKGKKLGTLDSKRPYLTHEHILIEIDVNTGKVGSVREKDLGLGTDKGFHQARGGSHVGNTPLPGGHGNRAAVYQKWRYEHTAFVVWNGNLAAVLDAKHPQALVGKGGEYLVKLNARSGKVTALKDKGSNGQGSALPSGQCVAKKTESIGAGAMAGLYNTPRGPEAWLYTAGDDGRPVYFAHLDRKHPSLPKDAGIIAKITNVGSVQPKFVFQTQGGAGSHPATTLFPKLPKGCVVVNHVK
ncbi:hypothetical protein ACSNOK_12095 [Streptomyces sp. URMC 126]|uniref:hypothetical protein n=1 Tax=Streptomyces sp. URMC 126 TaxID=3423401 RepID=UPI003F1B0F98